ncbi:MAG: hypothetical protein IK141_04520 [Clostridia bacterium]|nr:hypothetical protein [Clostridia bacterium]
MNAADRLLIFAVVCLLGWAVARCVKNARRGGCCGSCRSCSRSSCSSRREDR